MAQAHMADAKTVEGLGALKVQNKEGRDVILADILGQSSVVVLYLQPHAEHCS